jgi:hypothetical protein
MRRPRRSCHPGAQSVLIESEPGFRFFVSTRFLDANRSSLRSKTRWQQSSTRRLRNHSSLVDFVRRNAPTSVLPGTPVPFDGGLRPLLAPFRLKLGLLATGAGTFQAKVSMVDHVGGRSPDEFSHPLMCEAVSSWWAFLIRPSRRAQGRIDLASSRNRFASSMRRCSSDTVCLKRRRFCICMLPSIGIGGAC